MRVNIFSILLYFLLTILITTKEVDIFNLLLPTAYHPSLGHTKQLISTSGGCYSWQSSLSQIVSVSGHPSTQKECFINGLVELIAVNSYYFSIYITAKDKTSTQLINIPVRIRDLNKIAIFTKSKVMNLKQIQSLQIYGFDSQNNTFTSLQGLRFQWKLTQIQGSIKKMGIQQSALFLPLDTRIKLQEQHYQTDILVVKALKVGKVIVNVRCIEEHYQRIEDQIILYIQQRFDLIPSLPVYLLAGSTFQFQIKTTNGSQIKLPQNYYKIQINNGFICSNTLLLRSPFKQAYSILKVMDSRTSTPYEVHVQVYSYQPDELVIIVNEQIIVGTSTSYQIQAYYKKKLLKGYANMNVKSDFTIISTQRKIMAIEKKQGKIQVTYNNLRAQKKIISVLPLQIILPKKQILLPVDESFNLKVIGGSGYYIFESKDNQIAIISFTGQILSKKQGQTTIIIIDQRNRQNKLQIKLRVKDIKEIQSIEKQKQANINQETNLFLRAKNIRGQYYTSCNDLKIKHQQSSQILINYHVLANSLQSLSQLTSINDPLINKVLLESAVISQGKKSFTKKFNYYVTQNDISEQQLIKQIDQLQSYGICSKIYFTGLKSYDNRITFTTTQGIRTNIPLRIYKPILNNIPQQQSTKQILLTPLSSFLWKTTGGSYKWPDSQTKVFVNDVQLITKDKFPIISCSNTQSSIRYKIAYSNVQTQSLLRPTKQKQQILVKCQYPTSLQVYQKGNFLKSKIYIFPNQIMQGQIRAKNKKNQYFYNNSLIIWKVKDKLDFVQGQGNKLTYKNKNQILQDNILTVSSNYIIKMEQIIKYPEISKNYQIITIKPIYFDHPQQQIVIPKVNKQTKYIIKINQNINRDLNVFCTQKDIILCDFNKQTGQIYLITQSTGLSKIIAVDKTALNSPSIFINVLVLQPDKIIISTQKKQYMVRDQFIVNVQLFSKSKLITHFNNSQIIISGANRIKQISRNKKLNILYKGQEKGLQTLTGTLKSNHYLKSKLLDILIYPPFSLNIDSQLNKKNNFYFLTTQVMIMVNCKNYIKISGGPPYLQTQFKSNKLYNSQVKKIDQRTYQLLGITQGQDQLVIEIIDNGKKIGEIICKQIIKLIKKFQIYGNKNVLKGSQFRLSSLFVPTNEKIKSQCDFNYNWKSNQQNYIKILSNHSLIGVNISALNVGKQKIYLQVLNQKGKVIGFAQEIITVIDKFGIQLPSLISQKCHTSISQILIPPNSGLIFEKETVIQKKSPCEEQPNLLTIEQNKILTNSNTGTIFIVLKKKNQISVYTTVTITPITSLFIQNDNGVVKLSKGQHKKLKFYLLDQYNRLFFNNLIKHNYDVILSNPQILDASISEDNQYVQIFGKKNGKVFLSVSIKGQTVSDIVPVFVNIFIEPVGPVYVHIGDQIKFKAISDGVWKSFDSSIISIDQVNGWAQAKSEGKTQIQKGSLSTDVIVFRISQFQKLFKSSSQTQYVYQPIYPYSLKKYQGNYLNKRIHWSCQLVGDINKYFEVVTLRSSDRIICQITSKNIKTIKQIPSQITIKVIGVNKNIDFIVSQQFTQTLKNIFIILGSHYRNISEQSYHKIQIKTDQPLQISQLGGSDNWIISNQFYKNNQIIEIQMGYKNNKPWKLIITNVETGQTQTIYFQTQIVSYQSLVNKDQKQFEQKSSWSWTDALVIIMAINFIIILVIQCGQREGNPIRVY